MQNPLLSGLAELGKYLGSRLERIESAVKSTPQKIQLDVGDVSKSVKQFSDDSKKILGALPEMMKSNNKEVRAAVTELAQSLDNFSTGLQSAMNRAAPPYAEMLTQMGRNAREHSEHLAKLPASLNTAIASLKESADKGNEEIIRALVEVRDSLSSQKPLDLSPVILGLSRVVDELKRKEPVEKEDKKIVKLLQEIKDEFKGSSYKNSPYIIGGGSGQTFAKSVTVANVAMASADTEYSYSFPSGTIGWEVRLRADDVPLLIAYATGKLPTSGDGSAYFTVPAYYIMNPSAGVSWTGKTIYVQTASASQTVEIIVYKTT